MSSTPVEIGTLIVVILKARNLPNKRHIGKQDPYCTVRFDTETRRTKAVKRGGQHPEWDEEVRFTLFEDTEDQLARTAAKDGEDPPPPPPKKTGGALSIKGGKSMRVACYADDPREPDLIGEASVDLTEALTKGEVDEWFPLSYKDKYAGEVYLELTFWSNAKPPPKEKPVAASVMRPDYGGAGSFSPATNGRPNHPRHSSSGGTATSDHSRQSSAVRHESLPESLRPSSSLANLSIYEPDYAKPSRMSVGGIDSLANELSEFGLTPGRRRESFPPVPHAYATVSYSSLSSISSYHGGTPAPSGFVAPQSPQTPRPSTYVRDSYSAPPEAFPYAMPSSFQPGFPPQSSGFAPQPSATPVPSGFMPYSSGFTPPRPGTTPAPSGFVPTSSFVPAQPGFVAPQYPQPPATAPPASGPPPTPVYNTLPPPPASAPPQPQYGGPLSGYTTSPSPTHLGMPSGYYTPPRPQYTVPTPQPGPSQTPVPQYGLQAGFAPQAAPTVPAPSGFQLQPQPVNTYQSPPPPPAATYQIPGPTFQPPPPPPDIHPQHSGGRPLPAPGYGTSGSPSGIQQPLGPPAGPGNSLPYPPQTSQAAPPQSAFYIPPPPPPVSTFPPPPPPPTFTPAPQQSGGPGPPPPLQQHHSDPAGTFVPHVQPHRPPLPPIPGAAGGGYVPPSGPLALPAHAPPPPVSPPPPPPSFYQQQQQQQQQQQPPPPPPAQSYYNPPPPVPTWVAPQQTSYYPPGPPQHQNWQ